MGARGLGHIAYLSEIAPPAIGVVLNVGTAHLGEFGGREAIAEAKGELVEALPADGVAVLNADDARVAAMVGAHGGPGRHVRPRAGPPTSGRRTSPRRRGRARVHAATPRRARRRSPWPWTGEHQVANALAAAAVALSAGLLGRRGRPQRLSAAAPLSRWRMEVHERRRRGDRRQRRLQRQPRLDARGAEGAGRRSPRARRTWAVLGEMRELGDRLRSRSTTRSAGWPCALDVGRLVVGRRRPPAPCTWAPARRASLGPGVGLRRRRRRGARPAARRGAARGRGAGQGLAGDRARRAWPTRCSPTDPAADTPRRRRMRQLLIAGGLGALPRALRHAGVRSGSWSRKGYGQLIRDDGPTTHHTKRGTPTMGGVVIIARALAGYASRTWSPGRTPTRLRPAGAVPDDRPGARRLPRRLHQDLQAAQPRACAAGPSCSGRRSSPSSFAFLALQFPDERRADPGVADESSFMRDLGASCLGRLVLFVRLGLPHHRRHVERGEPHRRARRPGHRAPA